MQIAARGHTVERINLSGGDRVFWPRLGAVDYRGRFPDWRSFLGAFLHERGVSDVILFGDCRPYHRVAVDLARSRGIAVHVFEEGYFRPDWITLERDGTNGHSRLPRGAGGVSARKRRAIGERRARAAAGQRRHFAAGALGDPEPDRHDAAGAALSALPPPPLAPSADARCAAG